MASLIWSESVIHASATSRFSGTARRKSRERRDFQPPGTKTRLPAIRPLPAQSAPGTDAARRRRHNHVIVTVLSALATCIGMTQACALLDQTRKLRRAGSAQEVSVMFLLASLIGNVIWFAYGTLRVDPALLVVNSAGLIGGGATLITAVRLRRRSRLAAPATGPSSPQHRVDVGRRTLSRRDVLEPSGSRNVLESQRRTCRMAAGQLPAARFQNAPTARATARAWAAQAGSGATPRTPARGAAPATRDARPRMRRTCTTAPAR
ncbi:hypothetical protein GCM10023317_52550 [Actinopolymorpha pittospori]